MYKEKELINDQYEVRRRLAGGMGYVYIVFDQVSQKVFAIKTLKDELLESTEASIRFEREARTWMNLGVHQNIVHAIAFYRGQQPLLILEYIDGLSLQRLLRYEPAGLSLGQTARFAVQMSTGLAYAHGCPMPGDRLGVIHRDLKPGNIMITKGCTAKLTDFGLARAQDDSELTSSNRTMGSLPYMPPEQWQDAHSVTEKADIYSLGVVLYEMLTGTRPFPLGTPMEIMYQVLNIEPEPVAGYRPDADPAMVDLIMRCLRKRPEERPGSAEDLFEQLEEIQARQTAEAETRRDCRTCGYIANREHMHCPVCGTEPEPEPREPDKVSRLCRCGQAVPEGYRFCIHCGQDYEALGRCTACGEANPPQYRFCCRCGSRLSGSEAHR